MSVVSVYAIFANAEEAERIGRIAVEERLAACINILPNVRSIYRWQGAVETSDEVAGIFKTDRPGRRADHAHRRAPQLRGSLHRHLADRQGDRELRRLDRGQRRLDRSKSCEP